MKINYLHKGTIFLGLLIVGAAVLNSVNQQVLQKYSELSDVTEKYDLVSIEPIVAEKTVLSSTWFKHAMVSSMIDVTEQKKVSKSELILKLGTEPSADNLYLLSFGSDEPLEKIQSDLKEVENVAYVEANYEIFLGQEVETPADNLTPEVELAAEDTVQIKATDFKVGIIDSGVDLTHKDFTNKNIVAQTFIGGISDEVGHGTHITGLILSKAPDANIYSYKFTDGKTGKLSTLIKAIYAAKEDQVDILNLSLGLPNQSAALKEAIDALTAEDILVVAAAGNQNSSEEFYPAAYQKVIGVAGLNNFGQKLQNSNYGDWVDFSTDGQDLFSTGPGSVYMYLSGTSQSAALVTGAVANQFINNPDFDSSQIDFFLKQKPVEVPDQFADFLGARIEI
jgi:subtilisin family serine protease